MYKTLKYFTAWVIFFTILFCGSIITRAVLASGSGAGSLRAKAAPTVEAFSSEIVPENVSSAQAPDDTSKATTDEKPADKKPEIIKYVVKSGDTLGSIAAAYGIKVSSITESNGIEDDATLKDGQELQFPSVDGIVYSIKSGETLWDLSSTYGVDTEKIVAVNNLSNPDSLKINQEIILPGVDKVKVSAAKSSVKDSTAAKPVNSGIMVASRGGSPTAKLPSISGGWPLSGGVVTSGFGYRGKEFHQGIDIAAPIGTPVHAFADGKVVFAGWGSGGYGNLVIIDNGNGVLSYYGHNSKILVNVGDTVTKGQVISDVGQTGNATGPHVHFEIRVNGVPTNPYNFVSRN